MAVVCACLCSVAAAASAHPEVTPTMVNRYLTVAVLDDRVEVSMALLFGELPGAEERTRLDVDRDGIIGEEEKRAAQTAWAERGAGMFEARIDERRVTTPMSASITLNDARVGPLPLVIEVTTVISIPRARHELIIGPAQDPPRPGETEVGAVIGPGWKLVTSRQGPNGQPGQQLIHRIDADPTLGRFVSYVIEPADSLGSGASSQERERKQIDESRPPTPLVFGMLGVLGIGMAIAIGALTRRLRRRAAQRNEIG